MFSITITRYASVSACRDSGTPSGEVKRRFMQPIGAAMTHDEGPIPLHRSAARLKHLVERAEGASTVALCRSRVQAQLRR